MHGLDHQAGARAQHPSDLAQHVDVLLIAEVAERAEEVQDSVEALVREGKLAVVGLHQLRPPLATHPAPRLGQQGRRAIDTDDPEVRAGERHRVAAEPAGDVEQVAAGGTTGEARRGQRLRLGLTLTLVIGVRAQIEIAEERIPCRGRAGSSVLHATRV